jgi:hypothetical protein
MDGDSGILQIGNYKTAPPPFPVSCPKPPLPRNNATPQRQAGDGPADGRPPNMTLCGSHTPMGEAQPRG